MQFVLDDHTMNPNLVARFMDVASGGDYTFRNFESHLVHGILSRDEIQEQWIQLPIAPELCNTIYTPSDEISVFDMNEFRYQTNSADETCRQIAIFLSGAIASKSAVRHVEIDHPVIHDSVPQIDRKILGIYLHNSEEKIRLKVIETCQNILGYELPIVYPTWRFARYTLS